MKKVAVYFLFLCFYLNAKAQRENYWQLGGGGGFNWFWLYNKNDFAGLKPDVLTDKPNSYCGGISGGYFYKHYFGVEAKIFYSLQNQYYTTQGHDPRYNYFTRTRLEYLSVPIMVTFANSDEDAIQFIGKIGIASRVLLRYNASAF